MGEESLSLYWYECRIIILAHMGVTMKGIVMGSDRNLLGIIGNLLGIIGNLLGIIGNLLGIIGNLLEEC